MTDPQPPGQEKAPSAGALLRAARERAGVHIGVLAATLKVPVRKLELLEESRFDELPDATFVRALSLSVCRVLKCDAAPVLAALPRQEHAVSTLEQVTHGMNARFSQRGTPAVAIRPASKRLGWFLTALILVLAALAWWAPDDWRSRWPSGSTSGIGSVPVAASPAVAGSGAALPKAPSQSVTAPVAAASGPLVQTVHGAPQSAGLAGQGGTSSSTIAVTEASWIEATDLQGRPVWTRTLTPGEVVDLDSGAGVRLTIGNAAATQVRWRGQSVDLTAATRDNVARLELK